MIGVLIIWFCFKKKDSTKKIKLTEEEEDAIIAQYDPLPLVSTEINNDPKEARIIESKYGKYIVINGVRCVNLATHSFLGLSEHADIEESAIKSIKKYGVGSCGPRGFYGTVDVHLELEEQLAKFMGVDEAIVYSYGFSTIASAIPAYAKRGDIIFADEEVNFAIQKGLDASRSEIKFFKHNNMEDLERLLVEQHAIDMKNKKKAARTRRFLVVEGIYIKTGKICPLPELISLRKKHKLRIFIDESISFGTLGSSGRGVTEHFNVPMIEVDLIMASMECALASVGGFCLGSTFIVEHQRLSSLGYCFSASLPPLLTSAAIKALDIIENNPHIIFELQEICISFHDTLCKSEILMEYFFLLGDKISPIKHLRPRNGDSDLLNLIVKKCEEKNLAVTQAAYLKAEKKAIIPSIRLSINRLLTSLDITICVKILEESVFELCY